MSTELPENAKVLPNPLTDEVKSAVGEALAQLAAQRDVEVGRMVNASITSATEHKNPLVAKFMAALFADQDTAQAISPVAKPKSQGFVRT